MSQKPRVGDHSAIRWAQALTLVLLLALSALIASQTLGGGDPTQTSPSNDSQASVLPESLVGAPAPSFRLTSARGGTLSSASLDGRPYAVTFLYTQCPDVCPIIGQEIKQALEMMGSRSAAVTIVGVSVDPEGDTPDAARTWLDRQRLPQNFRYLIGSRKQLAPLWSRYFAAPQIEGRPETSTHTASIWLIDRNGKIRTKYSAGAPIDPRKLAADLVMLAGEEAR